MEPLVAPTLTNKNITQHLHFLSASPERPKQRERLRERGLWVFSAKHKIEIYNFSDKFWIFFFLEKYFVFDIIFLGTRVESERMRENLRPNIPDPDATRGCRAELTRTNSDSSAITLEAVASTQPSPHSQISPPVISFFQRSRSKFPDIS